MAYVTAPTSLPRSLDVVVNVSKPQSETRTNLSIPVFVGENLGFFPNASRIRFYSTIEAVELDFAAGTEAHFAATAFFSQTPRATTMAIAEAFTVNQAARLVAGAMTAAEITALASITDGSFKLTVDGVATDILGMDFTGVTNITAIAAVIQAQITVAGAGATCSIVTLPGGATKLVIFSATTGDTSTIAYPIAAATGTNVSDDLKLLAANSAILMQGYTVGDLPSELTEVQNAARAADQYLYGWVLDANFRVVADQLLCAAWALARTVYMPLVTNSVDALDANVTTDLGSELLTSANRRVSCIYHNNAQAYPDMSLLAYMLSVNYQIKDSTVTAKFKQLPGIDTVPLTETEWTVLKAKGYDTYTQTGNDALVFREGTTESDAWFVDTVINIDNFVEDLTVAVYNVFLRNKKVPYTRAGSLLLQEACKDVGYQYTYNGTFADREVLDTSLKSGSRIVPAVVVEATPISQMSASDRANRVGPPIAITVQEAGAIHTIAINVDVVS